MSLRKHEATCIHVCTVRVNLDGIRQFGGWGGGERAKITLVGEGGILPVRLSW